MRYSHLAILFVCALTLAGCELLIDIAAEVGEVSVGDGLIGEAAVSRTLGTAAIAEEAATSNALRGLLEDAATGPKTLRVSAAGELIHDGARVGSITQEGVIRLVDASGSKVFAGQVLEGRLWTRDIGSNVIQVGRVTGMTVRNGVSITRSPGGDLLYKLDKNISVDVLRARGGQFEIRLRGNQPIGWVAASALAVAISAEEGVNHTDTGASICAEFTSPDDKVMVVGPPVSRPGASSDFRSALSRRNIDIRYFPSKSAVAKQASNVLTVNGAVVRMIRTDSLATEICGGDVYYGTRDLASALSITSAISEFADLRTTSLKHADRIVVWLK